MKIRKISHRRSRFQKYAELGHFTLLFCTKIYNARAQPLFYSLNLLFVGVVVAVAVVLCLS